MSETDSHAGAWDEAWRCPLGHIEIAMGTGKSSGGRDSGVVELPEPPHCYCGREMEQVTHIFIEPDEIDPSQAQVFRYRPSEGDDGQ